MKRIRKYLFILITIISSFGFITQAQAASATVSVSSNKNTVVVGSTVTVTVKIASSAALGAWEYTLNYDSTKFSLQSSSVTPHHVDYASNGSVKSKSYTYSFKALKSGSAKFSVSSVEVFAWSDDSQMSISTSSSTVTIKTQAEIEATYSANADLSSLTVEGFENLIAFNKDTLEYSIEVPSTTTSINIKANKADNNASVSGAGEHEVSEGLNKFEIVVTAQKGNEKTYILNINVIDQNPINVTIDGNIYNVVKKAESLTKPQTYEETTTYIEGIEVPAFVSEITGYTLIGLKDSDGNIYLYRYNDENNIYTKYIELTLATIIFNPLSPDEELSYTKTTVTINDLEVITYRLSNNSDYYLIYGMNVETGNVGWYLYDSSENTLQRYDTNTINELEEGSNLYKLLTYIFGGVTAVCLITIIMQSSKYKTLNKKINFYINDNKEVKDEEQKEKKNKKHQKIK